MHEDIAETLKYNGAPSTQGLECWSPSTRDRDLQDPESEAATVGGARNQGSKMGGHYEPPSGKGQAGRHCAPKPGTRRPTGRQQAASEVQPTPLGGRAIQAAAGSISQPHAPDQGGAGPPARASVQAHHHAAIAAAGGGQEGARGGCHVVRIPRFQLPAHGNRPSATIRLPGVPQTTAAQAISASPTRQSP